MVLTQTEHEVGDTGAGDEGKVGEVSQAVLIAGVLKTQMASWTRQVMEMCDADGCKTVGNDGDCGELGECLPRLKAFKLKTKHTEDQTKIRWWV